MNQKILYFTLYYFFLSITFGTEILLNGTCVPLFVNSRYKQTYFNNSFVAVLSFFFVIKLVIEKGEKTRINLIKVSSPFPSQPRRVVRYYKSHCNSIIPWLDLSLPRPTFITNFISAWTMLVVRTLQRD